MKSKPAFYEEDYSLENRSIGIRQKTLVKIVCLLVIFFSLVLIGFWITPEQLEANIDVKHQSPTLSHIFGTDWLGRDMFARVLKGLNLSFQVGAIASLISTCLALGLSILASMNRTLDYIVTFLIDLFLSVPHLLALIIFVFVFGGGIKGVVLGIALTHWPTLARLLRAELMQIKHAEYVKHSKMLGKTNDWIIRHHFLPHLFPQLFVGFILLFPHAILHESAITFLGFGLSPEEPAIGIILSESMSYLSTGMWWSAFFPGLLLVTMVAVFEALGNSIRNYFYPKNN